MKQRIITAIILIILGVTIATAGIGIHIEYLYERYQRFAANGYFASFGAYYWAVGKGNLVVSAFLGFVPCFIGIYMLCKKPWWYKE